MGNFEQLKFCIAISLLLLHLSTTTEMHELAKVPVLIEHFFEHRSENQDLSFWDFISLHYRQTKARPPDYESDMTLPFKSIPEITCVIAMIALMPEPASEVAAHFSPSSRVRVHQNDQILRDDFPACIWQPPKRYYPYSAV